MYCNHRFNQPWNMDADTSDICPDGMVNVTNAGTPSIPSKSICWSLCSFRRATFGVQPFVAVRSGGWKSVSFTISPVSGFTTV